MLQIHITFRLFFGEMVFMAAKINLRQYVIFIKLLNFDTAAIKYFTVEQSSN